MQWVLVAISCTLLGLGILGVLYLVVQLRTEVARIARCGSELERCVDRLTDHTGD